MNFPCKLNNMHKHNEIYVTYYIVSQMDLAMESVFCANHRDMALLDHTVLQTLSFRKPNSAYLGVPGRWGLHFRICKCYYSKVLLGLAYTDFPRGGVLYSLERDNVKMIGQHSLLYDGDNIKEVLCNYVHRLTSGPGACEPETVWDASGFGNTDHNERRWGGLGWVELVMQM